MHKWNRRELTKAALATMAAQGQAAAAEPGVTHGPMLGHVTANEILIWGRTAKPGELRVRYGKTASRLDRLSAPVPTALDHDNAAWIRLTGLDPDTRYHFRLVSSSSSEGSQQNSGSFRTLPDAAQFRHPETNPRGLFNFRFEFGSCNNQKPGAGMGPTLPAFKMMREKLRDRVHFSILNGDWL
jgi:phosphodiesterase/alkaline phosphatase D-like protein